MEKMDLGNKEIGLELEWCIGVIEPYNMSDRYSFDWSSCDQILLKNGVDIAGSINQALQWNILPKWLWALHYEAWF